MYKYEDLKPTLFTDAGQRTFLQIRDRAANLLSISGAARLAEIIEKTHGDSWLTLACVDRLVELGEIREIPQSGVMTQHRIFVKP